MYLTKKLFLIIVFISLNSNSVALSDVPAFLDFKLILNKSIAGKKAQDTLQQQLDSGIKSINSKQKNLLEEEKKIIQQKKIISAEDYKKQVNNLRNKVSLLQKERNALLGNVAKQRSKARNDLLKTLNPILKDYMVEKNIKMVIDKKNILLADDELNITKDIMVLLNKKLKSIDLK